MEKELPKGWVETELFDLAEVKTGKKDANHASVEGKYIFFTCALTQTKSSTFSFDGPSVIVPGNGNIGYVFYYDGKFEAYQRTYVINSIKINSKFLFYHFKCFWKNRTVDNLFGSTIQYVKIGNFKKYLVLFPPKPEQERIVAKLDKLFSDLELVQERLSKITLIIKSFRQSVLTQAVTGKLTEEWRAGKELDEWKKKKLGELIIDKPRNGFSPQAVDYLTSVKSLSLSATTSGKFDKSKIKYLDIDKPEQNSHLWLKKGDILIQRSNSIEYVGTSAIYDGDDDEFIYPDIMIKIQVNNTVLNTFMYYVLSSSLTRNYFKDNATGTAGNMPKINQQTVINTPVYYPPLKEQQEIVKRVEVMFAQADAIEESYTLLKGKMEQLPQAILAKAFRGELVEQLPTDGDARDLLDQIRKIKMGVGEREIKLKVDKIKKKEMSKNIIKIIEALKISGTPLSGQELLHASGYPSDSSTLLLEKFYLDLRNELDSKRILKQKRDASGQDWFVLADL
jgi:type I restriction enzyme S subunit